MIEQAVPALLAVLGRINLGIVLVDRELHIVYWNGFMEIHTGRRREEVVGGDLLELFPELPRRWLKKKLEAVFLLGNYAFTSWHERPYLFQARHNRPITGGVDCMRQDCTFFPVQMSGGVVDLVCITVRDVTDAAIIEGHLGDALRKIEILSTQDALTGLFNRRMLEEQLELELARARRYKVPLAAILLDLDYFKRVNDTYGHLAGDHVLREIARRVRGVVRSADLCARYGGEELALLLPSTTLEGALDLAERLRCSIGEEPIVFEGHEIQITTSAGVCELDDTCQSPSDLLGRADRALYAAKQQGRDRVVAFNQLSGAAAAG